MMEAAPDSKSACQVTTPGVWVRTPPLPLEERLAASFIPVHGTGPRKAVRRRGLSTRRPDLGCWQSGRMQRS